MRIRGNSGNDTLYGDDGDDTVIGGAGDDRLFGYGRDPFSYGAIDLDGGGDRIAIADSASLDIAGDLTVEAWIRLDGAQPQFSTIVAKGDWGYQIRLSASDPGAIEFITGTPGTPVLGLATISTTHLAIGVWYHVAGVVEGGEQRIYIDGQLENTTARGTTAVTTNDFGLWIGANDEMTGRYFNGAIADVRVWGTARTASEIAGYSHSRLVGDETGLAGNWVLDTAFGPYGEDHSPNGNDGQVIGNPTATTTPAIFVDSGNDRLYGGAGNDVLRGGAGNDWFDAGTGVRDAVYGGIGHDLLHANFSDLTDGVTVGGFGPKSFIRSIRDGTSNTLVFSEIEERDLTGGDGNDTLRGGGWDDVLRGGDGDDWFDAGYGVRDSVNGGIGDDLLHADFSGLTDGVTVGGFGPKSFIRSIRDGTSNTLVFSEIEERDLTGGDGNDTLRGGAWDDVLRGGDGDDWFDAGYGVRDNVYGGTGHDRLHADFSGLTDGVTVGGSGPSGSIRSIRDGTSNTIVFSEIEERDLTGGDGDDTLRGGVWDDILRGGVGDDWFDAGYGVRDNVHGGTGHDRLHADFSDLTDGVTVSSSGPSGSIRSIRDGTSNTLVFSEIEERDLTGGGGNDTLCGGAYDDLLRGGDGDDYFDAGYGVRDNVYGGTGHDRLHADYSGLTDGVTVGGFGPSGTIRSIRDGTSNTILFSEIEERDLTGGDGNDALRGGAYDDVLRGGDGDDYFDAGTGVRDAVYGGAGHDRLHADFSDLTDGVTVSSSGPSGSIRSIRDGTSNTIVFSEIEERDLTGGDGNDTLRGGAYDDVLRGGDGNDVLAGGTGNDRFYFSTTLDASNNVDRLTDYSVADDTIQLDDAVFTALTAGKLASGAFFIGSAAHDSDDRIVYDSASGALYYDSNGSAADGSVKFAQLAPELALTNADFYVA